MNVQQIRMPKAQAKAMLRDYRRQIQRKTTEEYRAVEEGLRWMARGRAVINANDAIASAGVDAGGRPNIAICRADRTQVRFWWGARNTVATFSAIRQGWGARECKGDRVTVDMGRRNERVEVVNGTREWAAVQGSTMVPLVPPAALQQAHTGVTALGRFHVLWEVEEWKPVPPRDPYLLQHLGGDLYVVLAEWDLTDLERAVIAGTRR